MKDLFVGMAIGTIAGALFATSPKGKSMVRSVKAKLDGCDCGSDPVDRAESEGFMDERD